MTVNEKFISEQDFDAVWGAYLKPSGDFFEFEDVRDQPPDHVWTVVETGDDRDGSWYAQPGFHVVNKIGYVMTKEPWVDSTLDAVYFLDDFEHDTREAV